MNNEKRDFDKDAAHWDENPARIKLARDIARAISEQVDLTADMDVLDFGCGTGLLSLQLQPLVGSVTGVDSSPGMLDIFNKKLADLKVKDARSIHVDLDRGDALEGNYDLVVSNMTLHHVRDIQPLLNEFHRITAPGGHLCIADLDPEGGKFHPDNTGVFHFGFDRSALRKMFTDAGFDDVCDIDAAEMVKPDADGKIERFSVFLLTAQKK